MADLADPLAVIRTLPPGSALPARLQLGAGWEMAWLIREEDLRIRQLGKGPEVEFRARLMIEPAGGTRVGLVPVVVRVGPQQKENLYESWLNERAAVDYSILDLLAAQPRITLHIYGDREQRRLAVRNSLASFAQTAAAEIRRLPPWLMGDFDQAREGIYRRHPSVLTLWSALKNGG